MRLRDRPRRMLAYAVKSIRTGVEEFGEFLAIDRIVMTPMNE